MNLYLETIPLNSSHLAKWLERRIARKRLGVAVKAGTQANVLDELPPSVATTNS